MIWLENDLTLPTILVVLPFKIQFLVIPVEIDIRQCESLSKAKLG